MIDPRGLTTLCHVLIAVDANFLPGAVLQSLFARVDPHQATRFYVSTYVLVGIKPPTLTPYYGHTIQILTSPSIKGVTSAAGHRLDTETKARLGANGLGKFKLQ